MEALENPLEIFFWDLMFLGLVNLLEYKELAFPFSYF